MSLLTVKLQLGLPYRNVWINSSLPWDKMLFNISKIIQEVFSRSAETWVVEKKVLVSSPQSQNVFRMSWKRCLNLWLWRWLRHSRNIVRSLIPYELWISNTLAAQGRVKFSFFLKTETDWVSNFPIKFVALRGPEIIVLRELQKYHCFVWFHKLYSS